MIKLLFQSINKFGVFATINKIISIFGIKDESIFLKKRNEYYSKLDEEQQIDELKVWFEKKTNEKLDLQNPKTFNQKIQWLKMYDSLDIKTELADKYLVRKWIQEKIGDNYLIPIISYWKSEDEIDFSTLPNKFVLKANHGSNMNIIVKDKNKINIKQIKKTLKKWRMINYGLGPNMEKHYINIDHLIIAEEYLENENSDLYDYKVHCFNGVPKIIQIIKGRSNKEKMGFYDLDWNLLNIRRKGMGMLDNEKKPECFNELIEKAKILSKEFIYVRVDFYIIDNKIYFGEMTFTPGSGGVAWEPNEANYYMGSLLELPIIEVDE